MLKLSEKIPSNDSSTDNNIYHRVTAATLKRIYQFNYRNS